MTRQKPAGRYSFAAALVSWGPHLLSLSRVAAAIPVILLCRSGLPGYAALLFAAAAVTDILDGWLARKLGQDSPAGARMDVFCDFFLIACLWVFFYTEGEVLLIALPVLLFSFLQFFLSSLRNRPVYDPLGKHIGSLGFALTLIILLSPMEGIGKVCSGILVLYIAAAFGVRLRFLGVRANKGCNVPICFRRIAIRHRN